MRKKNTKINPSLYPVFELKINKLSHCTFEYSVVGTDGKVYLKRIEGHDEFTGGYLLKNLRRDTPWSIVLFKKMTSENLREVERRTQPNSTRRYIEGDGLRSQKLYAIAFLKQVTEQH